MGIAFAELIQHDPAYHTMSYEILNDPAGTITLRISGKLTYAEYTEGQRKAGEILRRQGKMRGLILIEDYLGAEKAGNWGDISFAVEFDQYIEKMAIVGNREWKDEALLFTAKGVRPFPIEYFEPADLAKAKAWLAV